MQHGFGVITLKSGKQKKGKFENNIYVGKVQKDTVKPEPLEEDKIVQKKKDDSGGILGLIRSSYDMMTQTIFSSKKEPRFKERSI